MIGKKMLEALNAHIQVEQFSSQLYLAMSVHLASLGFKGFAHWLRVQDGEETAHAMKMIDHVVERGGEIELRAIEAPGKGFGSPLEVFEHVYKHEQHITAAIHALFDLARAEHDLATEVFLQWFVSEQVEEEARVSEILDRLRAIGDKGGAVWYLDKEAGKRQAG